LSATLRFFEFSDLGRFVRRIFSIAWVFATAPAAGPLEFLTTTGLTQPGATALFRIYVITATGNERGSNIVTITRPPRRLTPPADPGHGTRECPRTPRLRTPGNPLRPLLPAVISARAGRPPKTGTLQPDRRTRPRKILVKSRSSDNLYRWHCHWISRPEALRTQTFCKEMNAPPRTLLIFHFTLLSIGCGDRSRDNNTHTQPLNTSVTIDFSLARGEDPAPFVKALTRKLDHLTFPLEKSELPTGLGAVWVLVQDDNLTETYKAFEQSLAETGDPYHKQIGISVRTTEVSSKQESPEPSNPR
jgi:hypothetical protein